MLSSTILSTFVLALASTASAKSVSATPHDKYSSSIGVLGCKIDTNRVAYWPGSVDCDNICIKLTSGSRSVHLLRIDQSGGAYDISYDAWVYLQTGKTATDKPITGGGVDVDVEEVDASECASLIHTKDHKLPLSASNSINFLTSCLEQPDSFIAKNHVLYNICDPICTLGYDETCKLDLTVSNQPSCTHTLGLQSELTSAPVYDVEYESGNKLRAGSGGVVIDVDTETANLREQKVEEENVETVAPETAPEMSASESVTSSQTASSQTGGIFVESGSTTVSVAEATEIPDVSTEVSIEPTSTSETVISVPERTTPASEPTTLVTVTSTTSGESTTEVSIPTSSALVSPSVSHSDAIPSGTPSFTPVPENAGHSLADVPLLLLISSMLLCMLAI